MLQKTTTKKTDRIGDFTRAGRATASENPAWRRYPPLLDAIVHKTVEKEKPLDPLPRSDLAVQINATLLTYLKDSREITLRKIARPLATVITHLDHEPNMAAIIAMFGAPIPFPLSQDRESLPILFVQTNRALHRYEDMMRDLKAIATLSEPPAKQSVGKKEHVAFRQLVDALASIWETWTGTKFTRLWIKKKNGWVPGTIAMVFVHEIVTLVDPARVGALPKTTEKIVAQRRRQAAQAK